MGHLIGRELPAKTLVVGIDCGKATHRVMLATGEQGVIGEPVSLPTLREGVEELAEETGIKVSDADLVPFGCLSEAEAHTIHYPNGDVTHCFALCFLATTWKGDARPNEEEVTEAKFVDLRTLPEPIHSPTAHALGLLAAYHSSGIFQVR